MSLDEASTNDSTLIDDDLVASLGFEPTTVIEPIPDVVDVRDGAVDTPVLVPDDEIVVSTVTDAPSSATEVVEVEEATPDLGVDESTPIEPSADAADELSFDDLHLDDAALRTPLWTPLL
ncbi:MAG: hypothetical protein R2706_06910 [Acidimicrobiales bacterium]